MSKNIKRNWEDFDSYKSKNKKKKKLKKMKLKNDICKKKNQRRQRKEKW